MGMPISVKAVCPIDGTEFEYRSTPSYTVFGRRLDGCPFGSWRFPLELPRCPQCRFPASKGLVSEADQDKARALAASPEFAAVKDEADYYVLAWVLEKLGVGGAIGPVDRLMNACWEVGPNDARYGRYAQDLGQAMDGAGDAIREQSAESWVALQSFIANIQRQAGDWAGAVRRLDALEASGLDLEDAKDRIDRTRELIADADRGVRMARDE